MTFKKLLLILIAANLITFFKNPTQSIASWVSMGGLPGANDTVYSTTVDDKGNLYIGGKFTAVGNVKANHIAMWDGYKWSALSNGTDLDVYALYFSGHTLYVGGNFTTAGAITANKIAKWDGTNWSTLGKGLNNYVNAITVNGNDIYIGGKFTKGTNSDDTTENGSLIIKWDGVRWISLAGGFGNSVVSSSIGEICISGGFLYAGGYVGYATNLGNIGLYTPGISKWDGTNWNTLGTVFTAGVSALTASGNEIYAGGGTTINYRSFYTVQKWNGNNWASLGNGFNGSISSLVFYGTNLYAGGSFTTITNSGNKIVIARKIAKWDGVNWNSIGLGVIDQNMISEVLSFTAYSDNLFIGGYFSEVDNLQANYVVQLKGTNWSALGTGMNGAVNSIVTSGTNLIIGGQFFSAGSIPAHFIVQWDGSVWSNLGLRTNSDIYTSTIFSNNLYAGGGPINSVSKVLKWDGLTWSSVGNGFATEPGYYPVVYTLTSSKSDLYAGGNFNYTTNNASNLVLVNNIAKWNGSYWSPLGGGLSGKVNCSIFTGDNYFVGGEFSYATNSGNKPLIVNFIAKWDGTNWSALGQGISSGVVYSLASSGTNLYVGGSFMSAGGITVNKIAKWDGFNWSSLGIGMNSNVTALAVSGTDVFAGGSFTSAGGISANRIAKWDGINWTSLDSGVDGDVYTINVLGSDIFIGGNFTIAGGLFSAFIAKNSGVTRFNKIYNFISNDSNIQMTFLGCRNSMRMSPS